MNELGFSCSSFDVKEEHSHRTEEKFVTILIIRPQVLQFDAGRGLRLRVAGTVNLLRSRDSACEGKTRGWKFPFVSVGTAPPAVFCSLLAVFVQGLLGDEI